MSTLRGCYLVRDTSGVRPTLQMLVVSLYQVRALIFPYEKWPWTRYRDTTAF